MAQTILLKRRTADATAPVSSDLATGEIAVNAYSGKLYVKKTDGTVAEISGSGGSSGLIPSATFVKYEYTATSGQTTFSGNDDNSQSLTYVVGNILVYKQGELLDTSDYTASNGSSIVLGSGATANDIVSIISYNKNIGTGNTTIVTFSGNGSTTAFTLSEDPGSETNTRVFIDGIYQSKSNYSVSGTTLTFSTAPPSGTGIEVEIGNREISTSGITEMTITGDLTVDTNTLFVDSSDNRVGIGTTSPSTALQVAGTATATAFAGPLTGNVTGNVSGSAGSTTGNAATATALANARTISGTSFDGTANITLNTSGITENTNLYYTDARVASYLSTNSYATQSWTTTQINNLIDSAPGALNTLNELAAALGDDASFSTTMTNSLALKVGITASTGAAGMPVGTTGQRPGSPAAGQFRYNSTLSKFEGYTDSWGEIGGGGGSNTFTTDNFTGNNSTTAFTLSQAVESEDNLIVFEEGIYQNKGDYTLSGTTLTFDEAPASGRKITVFSVKSAISGSNLNQNSFTGNGSTAAYTLSLAPVNENNTQVFLDGVYQHKNTYSVSGTTLTFDTNIPNGTAIEVMTFNQTDINVPVDNTITTAKIVDDAVTAAKLASNAVVTASIVDDAVTVAKLASNAVDTANIVDGSVTSAKLASGLTLGGNTAATLSTAAQPNITSVGTLTALQVDNINVNANTISSTDTNGNITIAPNGTGDIYANTDKMIVLAAEGESATLMIVSDESDDNGDDWSFVANQSNNTLTIENDISGSSVAHLTLTPHATVASSTATFAGILSVGNINVNGNTISSTNTNGNIIITPNGTGNVNVNTDVLAIQGTEGETASLALQVDESDDAGDEWRFTANTNQTLSIKNNISGSEVDHITLTPHATVASSTVSIPGVLSSGEHIVAGASYATLRLEENDATDLNTSMFNSGGDFVITTSSDNRSTTTDRLRLDHATGNIGIGVGTTVDELLNLEKSSGSTIVKTEVASNSTVGFEIKKTGSTTQNWRIVDGQTVNGKLEIYDVTDSRSVMTFDGSGNVGIGEASPDKLLHLKSSGTTGIAIESTTNAQNLDIDFYNNSGSAAGRIRYSEGPGTLNLSGNVTGIGLTVEWRNKVGIGQASPEGKLHIENASSGTSISADGSDILIVENSSSTLVDIRSPAANAGGILFSDPDARGRGAIYYYHNSGLDSMYFNTGGGSGRMIIDSAGKVGIGAAPSNKVDIFGTGGTRLKVTNTDTDWAGLDLQSGGNQSNYIFFRDDSAERARIQISDGNDIRFWTGSSPSEKFTIASGGNVGIGDSTPDYKLDVEGTGNFNDTLNFGNAGIGLISWGSMAGGTGFGILAQSGRGLSLGSHGGWDKLVINTSGDVGIGEASPDHRLVVKGATGTSPVLQLINADSEDTDTGREFTVRFSGFRSGGEATNNAQISGHSSGGSDDQKGELRIWTSEADGTMDEKVRIGSASNSDLASLHSTNNWPGGINMVSQNGTSFQIHHDNTAGYGLMFNGEIYVVNECSAASFHDRTPYPTSLDVAKAVIQSHEKLPDGQYEENNIDNQLDHSKLHAYVSRTKTRKEKLDDGTEGDDIIDKSRDMSATVSCLVEVTKDLMSKLEAAEARIQTLESS